MDCMEYCEHKAKFTCSIKMHLISEMQINAGYFEIFETNP